MAISVVYWKINWLKNSCCVNWYHNYNDDALGISIIGKNQ